MALIDKVSKYGPTTPIGKPGTGTAVDVFAFETGAGQIGATSKYGPILPYGKRPSRYEDLI